MKKALIAAVVVILLFVGYVAAGPFITINAIKNDIAENNAGGLAKNIDFPKLRENLKAQIEDNLLKEVQKEMQNSPFAAMAHSLMGGLVEQMLDAYVTPTGLAQLMAGKEAPEKPNGTGVGSPAPTSVETAGGASQPTSNAPKVTVNKSKLLQNASMGYESPSEFAVTITGDQGDAISFILEREGISWKLTNIVLPF